MTSHPALAFLLLFSASFLSSGDGGKVLVFPVDGSHWINMKILVEALYARGHQITVLRSSTSWYISEFSPYYTSFTITQEEPHNFEDQAAMTRFMKKSLQIRQKIRKGSLWALVEFYNNGGKLLRKNHGSVAKVITSIFENETLFRQLNETGYDIVLTDPVLPGGVLLAHYLKLPLVLNVRLILSGEAHFTVAPSPLSYVPAMFSHFSDKMDFFQRAKNMIYYGAIFYMSNFVFNQPYQAVCDQYFGKNVSFNSLMQAADLWLMRVDFTFEFPRPTMPNVVYIGGFQGKPSKPLPLDLEEFVQSSGEHGIIVMTLGTLLSEPGPELSETIASAFAKLSQKVIWRYIGKRPATLGNNTMLVDWLPQNDILGHPKTKVFVTHGGTNSIYQAIYHGVPVLGMPLIFDQNDNMIRLKVRGVAEIIEVATMTVETLTRALKNVLDPKNLYKQKMIKLSQLHHDKPLKPIDNAVFWMEYVMRHKGAAHLRTESYKLPWHAYYCLDVMAFLTALTLFGVALMWVSCRWFLRFLITSSKSKLE